MAEEVWDAVERVPTGSGFALEDFFAMRGRLGNHAHTVNALMIGRDKFGEFFPARHGGVLPEWQRGWKIEDGGWVERGVRNEEGARTRMEKAKAERE